jgi:NAD+ kinase
VKAGIVSRPDDEGALNLARDIAQYLEKSGVDVQVETETSLGMKNPRGNSDLGEMNPDFMITIGGDGTILRTAMQMNEPSTPILGINKGSRGFLTEISPKEAYSSLDRVLEKNYRIEECIKLSSKELVTGKIFPDSLNEVLIGSSMPSKAIDIRIKVDGEVVIDVQSDGVMASTPVGSTAYNLSAGGSILHPELKDIILTAISPYSYFRSIVVPEGSTITLELLKNNAKGMIIIDGRDYTATTPMSKVEVSLSQFKTKFIRFRSFYERLERRLIFRQVKK